jgi:WD40 repeat protein
MDKDIFVSYSRRNQAVCQQLVAALARSESDTWVDWEGIPLSADWWAEIEQGIEHAETVLILLSHDWLASPVCHLEMAYARQLNKRIVPVVYGTIDSEAALAELAARELDAAVIDLLGERQLLELARENWRVVSKINWAFYREEDFTEGASKLLAALQTDLAHARAHTRLLTRALEWERGGRDVSLLLRGVDLDQAVGWLEYNRDKDPLPTELHTVYIGASEAQRKAEQAAVLEQQARELALKVRALNRARMLIASLAVFLVIAGLLTAYALRQRSEAIEQAERADNNAATADANAVLAENAAGTAIFERDRADREAQIAKARELAAQALGLIGNRTAQGMLLGVAAYQTAPVFEAESALLTLMTSANGLSGTLYHPDDAAVISVALSPDDRMLAVVYARDTALAVFDYASGALIFSIAADPPAGVGTGVTFLDETTLLLGTISALERITIDMQAGSYQREVVSSYDFTAGVPYYTVFSGDRRRAASLLVRGESSYAMRTYNTQTGRVMADVDFAAVPLTVELNGDGTQIIVNFQADQPNFIDLSTGQISVIEGQSFDLQRVLYAAFYDEQHFLFMGAWQDGLINALGLLDRQTGELSDLTFVPVTLAQVYLHPARDYVLATEFNGALRMYSLSGQRQMWSVNYHEGQVLSAVFAPEGSILLTGDSRGALVLWDLDAPPKLQIVLENQTSPAIAMSLAGERLAVSVENNSLRQYDITTGQQVGPLIDVSIEGPYLSQVYLTPDHARLYALDGGNGSLSVWDAVSGEIISSSVLGEVQAYMLTVHPDGVHALVYNPRDGVMLWDLVQAQMLGQPLRVGAFGRDVTEEILNMTFSDDGKHAAVVSASGVVVLYDYDGQELVMRAAYDAGTALQVGLRFSPDGTLLAISSSSNAVLVMDVASGAYVLPPLSGAEGQIYNLAFRPDGRVLAVLDGFNRLWLWDMVRGLPIGQPVRAHFYAYDLAFTADSNLVSVGSGPVISLWDFSPEWAMYNLCRMVGRNLSLDEWALYLGSTEGYRMMCSEITDG